MRVIIVALLVAAAGAGSAQPPTAQRRAEILQRVTDCRKIATDAQRLACFDGSVRLLDEAEARRDVVVADREQQRAAAQSAFGYGGPPLPKARAAKVPREEIQQLTTKAVSVSRNPFGQLVVVLEGGAAWQQTDQEFVGGRPRVGSTIVIKRAALGSYKMSIDGQIAVRARRID